MNAPSRRRNFGTVAALVAVIGAMGVLTSYSVTLYELFCRVTGYGGYVGVAQATPDTVSDRVVTIRFNADVDPALGWRFVPEQKTIKVRLGEQALAFYKARNLTATTKTGTAIFNVSPEKAGGYFDKIECFCFTEQTLAPGQEADLPVTFFVDPKMNDVRRLDDITEITLSYTFYPSKSTQQSAAPPRAADARRALN
ncbi:MAG: cytochrome c oxidase assembly protein [Rhodospirillaceae bacterium]